jgi:hypothetical protein
MPVKVFLSRTTRSKTSCPNNKSSLQVVDMPVSDQRTLLFWLRWGLGTVVLHASEERT